MCEEVDEDEDVRKEDDKEDGVENALVFGRRPRGVLLGRDADREGFVDSWYNGIVGSVILWDEY